MYNRIGDSKVYRFVDSIKEKSKIITTYILAQSVGNSEQQEPQWILHVTDDDIAGKDALIADAIGINEDDALAFEPREPFHKIIGSSDKVKGKDDTSDLEIDPGGGERKTWLGGKFCILSSF